MYRYGVDQDIVYNTEDLVLFRESPFACWMERLTLEDPGHGIPADAQGYFHDAVEAPGSARAQTLQLEGKDVIAIDADIDETMRRTATLAAMRNGVNYIVNGQLAVGPLSNPAELLMRTPGFSELGNYLYIPCETQASSIQYSAFRLCFLADLLHSLQGQLPPQISVLCHDCDAIPLHSEDYIYHYRSIKQRFMASQDAFRKHRMPDPLESAHFGRWSDCANKLLKQRALEPTLSPDDYREYSTDSLQNLEFIGSSQYPPSMGESYSNRTAAVITTFGEPPPASLRNPANVDLDVLHDKGSNFEESYLTPFSNQLMTNDENSD
jgi:hypothetical protein